MGRGWRGRARICLSVAAAGVCGIGSARLDAATTCYWTNSSGGTFNTAANWNSGAGPAPVSGDTAQYDLAATYTVTFTSNPTNVTVNQTAGTVTYTTNATRTVNFAPFNLLGGGLTLGPGAAGSTLQVNSMWLRVDPSTSLFVGSGNDWTVTQFANGIGVGGTSGSASATFDGVGTTFTANANADSGIGVGMDAWPGSGTFTLSNNALANVGMVTVSRGTMSVQSAADVTMSGHIRLGASPPIAGNASLTITGAGSTLTQTGSGANITVGASSGNTSSLTVADNAVVTTGTGLTTIGATGTIDYTGASFRLNGALTVTGGTFKGPTPTTHTLLNGGGKPITVQSAGKIQLTGNTDVTASLVSGTNTITVTGAGSSFSTTGALLANSSTTISVQSGGSLSAASMQSIVSSTTNGVTVDGSGSSLTLTGDLTAGSNTANGRVNFKNNAAGTIGGGLNIRNNSINALTVESGADVTVAGAVNIGSSGSTPPTTCYVTGAGSTFTQTGSSPVYIGGATSLTDFRSSFSGSITLGSGLLTVDRGYFGANGGTCTVGGDVIVKNTSAVGITSWANGKTMTISTASNAGLGSQTLSGNTITVQDFASSVGGDNVTLNGGSSLTLFNTHGSSTFNRINLATDGTAASITIGASTDSSALMTNGFQPASTWAAAGGSASVTINNGGRAFMNSGVDLAPTGTGSSATVLIQGSVLSAYPLLQTSRLNMQNNTTAGASAQVTITGATAQLVTTGSTSNQIGGAAGTGAATIDIENGGKFTLSSVGTLLLNPTGTLNISGGHVRAGNVAINGGKINFHSGTLSTAPSLTVTSGGQLDVNGNSFVVKNGIVGSLNGSTYTGITGLIQSGRGDGTWNGAGIVTSETDATTGVLTTIAVARASETGRFGGTFAGITIAEEDVLVMYTWGGDADLNGELNGDDYFYIDSNIYSQFPGFHNGDFDYNGVIDGDDYFILDSNILQAQSSTPFPTGLTAVPEPGVTAIAAGLLAVRRRSRFAARDAGGGSRPSAPRAS